jgi:hypothetical protein
MYVQYAPRHWRSPPSGFPFFRRLGAFVVSPFFARVDFGGDARV